ncbi:hypothetical protein Cni_G17378 [Canna indica]|uniref:Uncharacterized protein n=1 Tax=Canna indica TaxID=4628 RepID=A0AAQ3QHP1_9LILI|nr:hypothetical protein Cni_G17378 [Canna indica]
MEDKTDFYLGKNSYGKNDVWVLSWLTLPIYADFGWGKSVFMGRAQVNVYAMFYILRGPEEDGVTILLTMEKENMEELIKVFYKGLEVPSKVEAKTQRIFA